MNNYLLKNANLYRNQKFQIVDILIEDGVITEIAQNIEKNIPTYDLKGKMVSHNFIDMHVHLREPGFEYKETIASGSLSALYGGYGTVVAMANTQPCMDDLDTIHDFQKRVEKDAHVNVYTYSAITTDLKGKELVDMAHIVEEDIVLGFSDDGKGVQSDEMMDLAMQLASNIDSIIVAHCEDESELQGGCIHDGLYAKKHHLVGINSASEYKQVARDLELVRHYHNRYHVCHISTLETVELLRQAKKDGLPVSGEASPHHLILTEENIRDCHPNYKMNPPLRSKEDHQALIRGLNDQTIKVIATDHAPHAREEKNRPIQDAPFGIIGIQHAFPLLYTYLVQKNLVKLETILDALTTGPAHVLRLKGTVEVGAIANLCIFDLEKSFVIEEKDIRSKSINTPFLGVTCQGKLVANIINGKMIEMEEM
ncbi:dihydroorotase [Candidatus Stoquefichus massiliensis]|uniref:dihydroorotase n=1 Tax=Candidatus Stoquefichus massiliensis TaxID=1470350 RepID=UPI0004888233|nr:dihydroorotase [Candidatus Stoquefichus massiliensis]